MLGNPSPALVMTTGVGLQTMQQVFTFMSEDTQEGHVLEMDKREQPSIAFVGVFAYEQSFTVIAHYILLERFSDVLGSQG